MARILYGAPESESEEENDLAVKLRKRHKVTYLNDFLGFAFELSRCRDSILLPKKYELVIYDTLLYGENWLPEIRAEHFKHTITRYFEKEETPIIVLADNLVKDYIMTWSLKHGHHYFSRPFSLDDAVKKVNSLLQKQRRK